MMESSETRNSGPALPFVSVVIPAYNSASWIEQAVQSALDQTFVDYEVIVVDDGSTDDTALRVAQFGSRVRYIFQENQERSAARNTGIRLAQGSYVAFLDADDLWHPEKLARQVAFLGLRPEVTLVYGWAQCLWGDRMLPLLLGKDFVSPDGLEVFSGLLLGKSLPTLTVLVDRLALIQAGLFDPAITIGEDWDLWLRLSMRYKVSVVPEILAYYRLMGKCLPTAMVRANVPNCRVQSVERAFREARELLHLDLPLGLECRALAQAWWQGSLINYAVGDFVAGQERLVRSIGYDPEFHFRDTASWLESIIAFAAHLYDYGTPRAEAEEFLMVFFDNLPSEAQFLQVRYRAALGRLRAGYAFRMYAEEGLVSEARDMMRQAIRTYPPLVRNLGTLSLALRNTWLDRRKVAQFATGSPLERRITQSASASRDGGSK